MEKKILIYIAFFCVLFSSYAAKQLVSIETKGQSEVFTFAQQELKKFLSATCEFTKANASWQIMLQTNNELDEVGRELQALLDNRLRATIVYLKTFEKGEEIQQFDKKKFTEGNRKKIASILNESISGFDQYIKLYSELMPDRVCEGTLISAYYIRIDALKRIQQNICGIRYDNSFFYR